MKTLDDIIADLGEDTAVAKSSKTVSIRIPLLNLARIDAMASLKDTSRNVLLNDIIDVALTDLLSKLKEKNKKMFAVLEAKAEEIAQKLLMEHEPPLPPHHRKKRKDG